jgi:hypothetical protein
VERAVGPRHCAPFTGTSHFLVLRLVLTIVILNLTACGGGSQDHPSWQQSPEFVDIQTTELDQHLLHVSEALGSADVEWEIGTFDGPPETVFAYPVDIAVVGDDVYILDAMYSEIRVFTIQGNFVTVIGRRGRGPGEFDHPLSINATSDGQLVVAQPTGLTFIRRTSLGVEFVSSRHVNSGIPSPTGACLLNDVVYVRSNNWIDSGHLIFAIDDGANTSISFGEGYTKGSRIIQLQLSDGLIACVGQPKTVINAYQYLPLLRGYAPTGELRWTAYFSDFRLLRWTARTTSLGQMFGLNSREPGDMLLSLTALPTDFVIVQVAQLAAATRERPGRQRIERLRTYLVSVRTGRGIEIDAELPRILHADESRLWATTTDSIGFLKVLQLRYGR